MMEERCVEDRVAKRVCTSLLAMRRWQIVNKELRLIIKICVTADCSNEGGGDVGMKAMFFCVTVTGVYRLLCAFKSNREQPASQPLVKTGSTKATCPEAVTVNSKEENS
jgi:hypothetical protein